MSVATVHHCPACLADPGKPCTTTDGAEMTRIHYARGKLAGMDPAEVLSGCRADPPVAPSELVRRGGDDLRMAIAVARAAVDEAERLGARPGWVGLARRVMMQLEVGS